MGLSKTARAKVIRPRDPVDCSTNTRYGTVNLGTGGIPGPIAFGSMIDKSCLLWQDQCGEQGSCYVYQNSAMSRYTFIAGLVYKVMLPLNFTLG
ncbi:solute carrier organic anion transporter family member 4a1 [Limosa lapponica baueri]|uniref:Solute carrier organic anion transporter family member 4a1 n=1 Tax=Limosa lapponica baueri TaxID=1758121 RepID=A0A2I0T4M7_LIMLA|nr:solute carrier organic anion transporter family member 4a1 [Limosa lapponica baueri]